MIRRQPAATALAITLLAGVACLPAPASLAQTPAPAGAKAELCNATGIEWAKDPVFLRRRHWSDTGAPRREAVICTVTRVVDGKIGDTTLRLTVGRLNYEKQDGVRLPVRMVDIARLEANGPRSLARVLIDDDPVNRMEIFEPQFRGFDGAILLRLAPRHDWLFAVTGDAVAAVPAFSWEDALRATLPEDQREGRTLSVDLDRMEGRLALRKAGTDPAGPLPSAFDEARMAVAKLAFRDGKLAVDSSTILPRKAGDEPVFDEFSEGDEAARKDAGTLAAGVEPCGLGGWSNDTDPKGLNVRAEPHAKAKILGIVPPPRLDKRTESEFGDRRMKSEFEIFGYRDGWFLIGEISAPGVRYEVPYPRNAPKPFKGRGWVNAKLVGGAFANGGLPTGQVYASPHADARATIIRDENGNPISQDGTPFTLLACSGWWGLVEFKDGKRGWWRSICSNQVTNCS